MGCRHISTSGLAASALRTGISSFFAVYSRHFYMVSQRDLRTGNVDCGETGVAVGSLASAKLDCFRLVGI